MNNDTLAIRKRLIQLVGLIVLVVMGVLLWRYVNTGHLEVASDSSSDMITVKDADGDVIKTGEGKLTVSLARGQYTVSVGGKYYTSNKVVEISGLHTKHVRLSQPVIRNLEPVTSVQADDMVAGDNQLTYLNIGSLFIEKIDSSNTISYVTLGERFSGIKWATPEYGVGLTNDGKLSTISGSTVSPVYLPESDGGSSDSISYDVTSKKQLYVAIDKKLYQIPMNGGNPRLIYTAKETINSVLAGESAILLSYSEATRSADETKVRIVSLTISGKEQGSMKTTMGEDDQLDVVGAWSPDGSAIALLDGIYSPALKKLYNLPSSSAQSFVWLNNSHLVYAADNAIWQYDISSQSSKTLATTTPDQNILDLAVNPNASYVYVSTSGSDKSLIQRISLTSSVAGDIPDQLASYFPLDIIKEVCSVNFINMTAPTLLLSVNGKGAAAECQKALLEKTTLYGLSGLPVVLYVVE